MLHFFLIVNPFLLWVDGFPRENQSSWRGSFRVGDGPTGVSTEVDSAIKQRDGQITRLAGDHTGCICTMHPGRPTWLS